MDFKRIHSILRRKWLEEYTKFIVYTKIFILMNQTAKSTTKPFATNFQYEIKKNIICGINTVMWCLISCIKVWLFFANYLISSH